jgi:hypothetical protein
LLIDSDPSRPARSFRSWPCCLKGVRQFVRENVRFYRVCLEYMIHCPFIFLFLANNTASANHLPPVNHRYWPLHLDSVHDSSKLSTLPCMFQPQHFYSCLNSASTSCSTPIHPPVYVRACLLSYTLVSIKVTCPFA